MTEIKVANIDSAEYKIFKNWIIREWGEVNQLPDIEKITETPLPLLALQNQDLAGGLTFIYYTSPEKNRKVLWINSVYIEDKKRGNGIASKLILEAEKIVQKHNYNELYVYTDKPNLYLKLGWKVIKVEGYHSVLKKLVK